MNTATKVLKVKCPGSKVPVRSEPNPSGSIKRYLNTEDVVEVFAKTKSGFYELSDKSVSISCYHCFKYAYINTIFIQGFVNKNTKNVEWIEMQPEKNPDEPTMLNEPSVAPPPPPLPTPPPVKSEVAVEQSSVTVIPTPSVEVQAPIPHQSEAAPPTTDVAVGVASSDPERDRAKSIVPPESASALQEVELIRSLMNNTSNIRNVSLIGPTGNGKSTLADFLFRSTGMQGPRALSTSNNLGKFTDSREDEKTNGVSIKMNPITMYYDFDLSINTAKPLKVQSDSSDNVSSSVSTSSYLLNLLDTPGETDFSSEATAALRLSDGAIFITSAIIGVGSHTETLLRQVLAEQVKPVFFINKLDRALVDLQLTPEDIYQHIVKMIRKLNLVTSSYKLSSQRDWSIDPVKGSVAFGSASQKWTFTLDRFARFYATKFKTSPDVLREKLWGNWGFSPTADGQIKWIESETMDDNNGVDTPTGVKRAFTVFILNPILSMCQAVLNNELTKAGTPKAFLMVKSVGVELTEEEKTVMRGKPLLELILQRWMPCADTVLEMVTLHLPSPVTAQAYRVESLYTGSMDDEAAVAIRDCVVLDTAPLTMYISKMFHIKGNKFTAFGRVFSGTISSGQKVRILSPKYIPNQSNSKEVVVKTIEEVVIQMGQQAYFPIDTVPAGNLCGINGIDSYLLKTGTITTSDSASVFRNMKFATAPILSVFVNVHNPNQLPELIEGLKKLSKNDPMVQCKTTDYGDHIVSACGEFQLGQCLADLEQLFASGIKLDIPNPVVSYRETVTAASTELASTQSPNRHNRLFCTAEPLTPEVLALFDDGVIGPRLSDDGRSKLLKEHPAFRFGWKMESETPSRLWCFGSSEAGGPNILSMKYNGPSNVEVIQNSLQSSFVFTCNGGPLCDSPIRGLKLNITDVMLHADAIHRGMGQMIPTMRRATVAAMLLSAPALLEPIFQVDIVCPNASIPLVTSLLASRRGTVLDEGRGVSGIALMRVYIPVSESFGFSSELSEKTNSSAHCQMSFDQWKVVGGDFRDPTSRLNNLIESLRVRQGLKKDIPQLDEYIDKV